MTLKMSTSEPMVGAAPAVAIKFKRNGTTEQAKNGDRLQVGLLAKLHEIERWLKQNKVGPPTVVAVFFFV